MSDWLDQVETDSGGGGITYPLTDDLMKYDKVRHRYVLTSYFLNKKTIKKLPNFCLVAFFISLFLSHKKEYIPGYMLTFKIRSVFFIMNKLESVDKFGCSVKPL